MNLHISSLEESILLRPPKKKIENKVLAQSILHYSIFDTLMSVCGCILYTLHVSFSFLFIVFYLVSLLSNVKWLIYYFPYFNFISVRGSLVVYVFSFLYSKLRMICLNFFFLFSLIFYLVFRFYFFVRSILFCFSFKIQFIFYLLLYKNSKKTNKFIMTICCVMDTNQCITTTTQIHFILYTKKYTRTHNKHTHAK